MNRASHQVILFEQRPGDELEQRQHVDQPLLLQAQQTQHFAELLALHAAVLKNTKHPFVAVSSYLGINAVKSFGCYALLTVKKGGSLFLLSVSGLRLLTSVALCNSCAHSMILSWASSLASSSFLFLCPSLSGAQGVCFRS